MGPDDHCASYLARFDDVARKMRIAVLAAALASVASSSPARSLRRGAWTRPGSAALRLRGGAENASEFEERTASALVSL